MEDVKKNTGKPNTDEIATTRNDLDVFAGWLNRLENPDPVLRTESGGRGLKLYDEVDRDAHAGSVLQTRALAVAGREWEVLPASDKRTDKRVADFVTDAVKGVNFSLAVQELMKAVLYGFYVAEVMWTANDGGWRPTGLVGKHPRRFSFSMDRELRLLTPENMVEGEPVPERKFVVFTWGSADNPYGEGLGRKLWWPVWFKKVGIKWWLIFLEKFGMPTGVGKYPPGTDPDQQQALLDAIDAIQAETGVKIPDTMAIELLEATRGGTASYEKLCEYMDKQISKAVLGQTATTEGTAGKLGNEDAQQEVRADILKADADLLCECLNRTLVRWLVDFNFAPGTPYPRLWIRTEDEGDLKPLAERDKIILGDLGMAARVPETYISDTYGIPLATEGEATIGAASVVEKKENAPAFSESESAPDVTPVEPMADRMAEEAAPAWATIIGQVQTLVDTAKDLPSLRDSLIAAFADLAEDDLADVMAMGFAAADLAGRYDSDREGAHG